MSEPLAIVAIVSADPGVQALCRRQLAGSAMALQVHASEATLPDDFGPAPHGCVVIEAAPEAAEDFLRRFHPRHPAISVIVLAAGIGVPAAVRLMKAGAADVLLVPVDPEALLASVQDAVHAAVPFHAGLPRGVPDHVATQLTPRENDILQGMLSGKPSKRIAFELSISAKTVEHYRSRLYQKFNAANAVELARIVLQ